MNLYSVTVFDRKAPGCQFIVALWATDKWMAYRRASKCGRVVDVQKAIGTWPLDGHFGRLPK